MTLLSDAHESTAALVDEFLDRVWNGRELDRVEDLVAEDYELRNLSDDSVALRGRDQLRAHISGWLAAFPDLRMREIDRLDSGERLMSIVRIDGTHSGAEFQGVEAAGAKIDVVLVAVFDAADGRLQRHATLVDARGLLEQLAPAQRR